MRSFGFFILMGGFIFLAGCEDRDVRNLPAIIAQGQMPAIIHDDQSNLHLVYGNGDSIMYTESVDQGKSFSNPTLVAILPGLFSASMRGPQIALTGQGITIIAADKSGDIYSYSKDVSGDWKKTTRVNDVDTVAKEGLMAMSGDGNNLFAVWLDLRENNHNKIAGAKSTDGGKSWTKNMLIYSSPDSTVCECCKPSVVVKGNNIYVMFRNWLNGNRDLYLMRSHDGGNNFGAPEKLGQDSWALNGCPMDGGGIVINAGDSVQTVWRRHNKIFSCEPGKHEIEIGEGRNCAIESVNGKNIYAWTENGEIVCVLPGGRKEHLGKGSLPAIKAIDPTHIICIWENEKHINKAVLEL